MSFVRFGSSQTLCREKYMSRRINLWPVDFKFLIDVAGTNDASMKAAIAEHWSANRIAEMEPAWDDALRIATNVIDNGFSAPSNLQESDCHFLASQLLAMSCRLNRISPDSEFHWLSFLETFDICFSGPGAKIYTAFQVGLPWFGVECPFETVYGIIRREELPMIVNVLSDHRCAFGDDAEWMVDPQRAFFEFAANHNSDVWYSA